MTKEDALNALQKIRNMFKKGEASYVVLLNPQLIDVAIEALKNQSTVDAIPVEWLKEQYPIHGICSTEQYFRIAYAVQEILAEWERARKEQ